MEIERKYLVEDCPKNLSDYSYHLIEQGYLSTDPVVRIRRQDDDYILTYKSKGFLAREEYNLPLTQKSYLHLKKKIDGRLIKKRRYLIPYLQAYTIELDIFEDDLAPLILAEVEFSSEAEANTFTPPAWFGEDVTFQRAYHNSHLSII